MKQYDSHIHIGDYVLNKHLVNNSKYKDMYKLYSAINPEMILNQIEYTKELDNFFAIPLFFKETDIQKCNKYVIDYCNKYKKGIPTLLIDNNKYFDSNYNIAIFKEHFLLNDFLDWKDRTNYYDFLNSNEGYLLIHCADKIRVEYIKKLISNFPNMNIIIAHLGRDTYEKPEFIMQVINNFKDNEKVMFDLSTIHNIDNLLYAIDNVGTGRILYGSDFPFEFKNLCEIKEFKQKILNSIGYEENIFEKNFENIKKKIYVKK